MFVYWWGYCVGSGGQLRLKILYNIVFDTVAELLCTSFCKEENLQQQAVSYSTFNHHSNINYRRGGRLRLCDVVFARILPPKVPFLLADADSAVCFYSKVVLFTILRPACTQCAGENFSILYCASLGALAIHGRASRSQPTRPGATK